jgi:hypothetical protein
MFSHRLARVRRQFAGDLSARGLILLELVAIVGAVALGFWVNEWREQRARARGVEVALHGLARELDHNQKQAQEFWIYYRRILREIEESAPGDGAEAGEAPLYGNQLAGWRGAMPPLLRSSSFETLVGTGRLGDLPFEQADDLARVYNFQSVIERLDEAWLARMANDPEFIRVASIRHNFGLYSEMLPSLLATYEAWAGPILSEYGFTPTIADPELAAEVERRATRLR